MPKLLEVVLSVINRLDYNILNLEGHHNRITGSRVTAILLKKLFIPIGESGEASRWRVFCQRGLHRLVFILNHKNIHLLINNKHKAHFHQTCIEFLTNYTVWE